MVETNRTEITALYPLFARLMKTPVPYPTASKFAKLMMIVPEREFLAIKQEAEQKGATEEIAQWLNEPITIEDVEFEAKELADISMTPVEAYVINHFVKPLNEN